MNVKVIRQSGAASLIEYVTEDRSIRRVYVPTASIVLGDVAQATLDAGIVYGLPWEELLSGQRVTPGAAKAADELRRCGIWTGDDLRQDPNAAVGVLMAAFRGGYHRLLAAAEQYDKEAF